MICIILGELAQSEGNVLRLYLGIYSIEEGGTGAKLHRPFLPPRDTKRHLSDHPSTPATCSHHGMLLAEFWPIVCEQR